MKTFKEFYTEHYFVLNETIHHELQSILDSPETGGNRSLWDSTSRKLNNFTSTARKLIKRGEDTGLENDKPKKGSSRAVFFPKEDKPINIDGVPTKAKRVIKIAFPGALDKFKIGNERLLGEHQNEIESAGYTTQQHGMLRENDDGSYTTNPNGILAPVFGSHPDYHHLEMGHVTPLKKTEFQKLTVSESHPKGLKFDDMYNALNKEYKDAHGSDAGWIPSSHTDEIHEKTMQHPFVQNVADMMWNTGFHPGDISIRNMGIWTHPVTGSRHPVISDYGFSTEVAKHYSIRRKRQSQNR